MATEKTKEELIMAPTYNDYSQLQSFGLLKGINDYFQKFIKEYAGKDKVVLADYGCSGGKNSMVMIQKIYEFLKDSTQTDFLLQAFLTDLPHNDYNAVLSAYQESIIAKEKNIFLSWTVGSFYDQILPPNSVDLACSFSSLHWLSETEGLGSFNDPNCFYFSLADPAKDHDKIHYLLNIATKDVQNFLLARKKELVSGGLLMFGCLGSESLIPTQEERRRKDAIAHHQFQMRDVNSVPWNDNGLPLLNLGLNNTEHIGSLLRQTKEHFGIHYDPTANETQIMTVVPKNVEIFYEAINSSSELKNSFEILFCEVVNAPDPYWSKYVSGEYDLETFATVVNGFNRAWSETTIRGQLRNNDEAVEWFYEKMKQTILSHPQQFYFESNFLYVCLKKI
jgi:hypothetical protein